jgi:hypothetical protein
MVMKEFAIMCTVSFETEVYVDAENLPEAMEKLSRGEISHLAATFHQKFVPLDFIKPQVWDEEAGDFVPCNIVMFPVKDEVIDFEGED